MRKIERDISDNAADSPLRPEDDSKERKHNCNAKPQVQVKHKSTKQCHYPHYLQSQWETHTGNTLDERPTWSRILIQ